MPNHRDITIDTNYADRRGYDADFLGQRVNLPKLSPSQISIASKLIPAPDSYLLNYHHFSLAIHSKRRLPFFTAVNIDGKQSRRLRREDDSWHFDPRIPREHQIGHGLYDGNELDYGHLVRRLDPAWGSDLSVAKLANDDTFHFTNCAPQHAGFNRNKMTWAGLEDYLLKSAIAMNLRLCVFTGPILNDADPEYRGIQIPLRYWKVAVMLKASGQVSATAYVLDQSELLKTMKD